MKIRENEEDKQAIGRIGMFLEGLGVLVREGYVSIRLVALLMTGTIRMLWEGIYGSWVHYGQNIRIPELLQHTQCFNRFHA